MNPAAERRPGVRIVPAAEGMGEAVRRLRAGKLVAFPTETVYGLGADALDPDAVAGIFAAKGRPAANPLIVHVADAAHAAPLVRAWPPAAATLAARFWPGPLTLVVPKSDAVPGVVTAGGDTVGVRVPAHPVALELLRAAGVPVAAPSANRSEEVSPTTARHVADSLGPWVDDLLILDGGPTSVGVESTVVDVTTARPHVLRPGMISAGMLSDAVGEVIGGAGAGGAVLRSPGQTPRHYAPKTPLVIVPSRQLEADPAADGPAAARDDGVLLRTRRPLAGKHVIAMPRDAAAYAARLYAALRALDAAGVRRILVEEPPDGPEWAAIHDRLRRAAAPKDAGG